MDSSFHIRTARNADCQTILGFIRELAAYEKLADHVVAGMENIECALFGEPVYAHALIAELERKPVGFALYFFTFSTFLGQPGLYLEDLFIQPNHRGRGFGKALLKKLAHIARRNGCQRMDWAVLDWNQPAIDFYLSIGARAKNEWTNYRLEGEQLAAFAAEEKS